METIIGSGNGAGPQAAVDLIKESSQQDFAQDVIEASMQTPVIVDFWAPWCGPCKQLGPMLEKAVTEARGAVRMVKIDVDQSQELAAQLRIQSIPTVYAFFQGRPVDAFQGAQPESEIKAFVKRLSEQSGAQQGPSPVEQALEQAAAALGTGQLGQASALYGQVLQHEPNNAEALGGTIVCHLECGDAAGARQFADHLPKEALESAAVTAALAKLELAERAADAGPLSELTRKVADNPGDHQARLDLAIALQAAGKSEDAADELLEIVRRDRHWNEDAARKQLVQLFEAWGPTDPLTVEARRRLSSLLFS
jgi:putative thioredoxin